MSTRRHKRRRVEKEAIPLFEEQLAVADSPSRGPKETVTETQAAADPDPLQQAPTQESDIEALAKEQEIWDAVREEQYEVLEQLPLSLHRAFTLINELDQHAQERISNLAPAIHKYVSLRKAIAEADKKQEDNPTNAEGHPPVEEQGNTEAADAASLTGQVSLGSSLSPPPTSTPGPSSTKSRTTPLPARTLASVTQSSDSTRELLITIAQSAEEISRASNEKYYLSRHVYDLVDRYIRDLDRAIKEQEASISLGLRPGTHPASIILPELVLPKPHRNRGASSPAPEEVHEEGTVLGPGPVEETQNEGHEQEEQALEEGQEEEPEEVEQGQEQEQEPEQEQEQELESVEPEIIEPTEEQEPPPPLPSGEDEEVEILEVTEPVEVPQPEPEPEPPQGRRKGRKRRKSARAREAAAHAGIPLTPEPEDEENQIPPQPPLTLRIPAQNLVTPVETEMVDPDEPRYCFCNQVSYGEMIACDNPTCTREWFHIGCIGLKRIPKGKWYCRECESNKRKGKKRVR